MKYLLISLVLLISCVAKSEDVKLKLRNDFSKPEDVIRYYTSRDAAGFVWAGMLNQEVKAFTTWPELAQHENFLVAKSFTIKPTRVFAKDRVAIDVIYNIKYMSDFEGTEFEVKTPQLIRTFILAKISEKWKIIQPSPHDASPIILESNLPRIKH